MSRLVVVTAITGAVKDQLRPPLVSPPEGVEFVCFSDRPRGDAGLWDVRQPVWRHAQARRTARYHKLMIHHLFPGAEFMIWQDGNYQLKVDPWELVSRFLTDHDMAVYLHPSNRTIDQELNLCVRLRKDEARTMRCQVQRYKDEGMPSNVPIMETGAVLRRNSPATAALNELWWSEMVRGSCRDQLSLPYCMWRTSMAFSVMPGCGHKPVYFNYFSHR